MVSSTKLKVPNVVTLRVPDAGCSGQPTLHNGDPIPGGRIPIWCENTTAALAARVVLLIPGRGMGYNEPPSDGFSALNLHVQGICFKAFSSICAIP